jgi:hypothetical protein
MEADCIRTVTFFKIPVYKINFFLYPLENSLNYPSLREVLKTNPSWLLQISPIRKVNPQHLTNSLVQKLIAVSGDENNLSQIYKFKSILSGKEPLIPGDQIEIACSPHKLIVKKNSVELGEMQNISICTLLSRVYLDPSFREVPCAELITKLNSQLKNESTSF